ncbi:MAG: hypothetical protein JW774_09165 [Candidatus Aureabacteria bacterium]|nr:hypothetical protein [Candidatus Auribacterota bacterium]
MTNKRKLFVNNRVRLYFAGYIFFSFLIVILFLGWEFFIELLIYGFPQIQSYLSEVRGFPVVVKVILLLLWGTSSFLVAYTYLDAKFLGIFSRMNDCFEKMIHDDSIDLQFRKDDPFIYLGESFNSMKQMFIERIQKRKNFFHSLEKEIQSFSDNLPEDKIQMIVKKIDEELAR